MTSRKTTKRALLLSCLSMLLCISMLVGSTFAWFTDTASTGVNTIMAGNLDVAVEYKKGDADPTVDTGWATLQDADTLFGGDWEPGHTEVVYLRVTNKGSLTLKYKMNITPISETGGINMAGESFKLSNYMTFATSAPAASATKLTRDTAIALVDPADVQAAVSGTSTSITKVQTNPNRTDKTLAPNATEYIALVVYMPEGVGNDANYKTGTTPPKIELGITVTAAQVPQENDSFGSDYDSGAQYAPGSEFVDYTYAPQISASGQLVVGANSSVSKGSDADVGGTVTMDGTTAKVESTEKIAGTGTPVASVAVPVQPTAGAAEGETGSIILDIAPADAPANLTVSSDEETTSYDVKTVITGQVEASGNYVVDLFVGQGLTNLAMHHTHEGAGTSTAMTDGYASQDALVADNQADTFYYDATTGIVTMVISDFSNFTAVYDAPVAAIGAKAYYSLDAAVAAAEEGDTIVLLKDVNACVVVEAGKAFTLDLRGQAIRNDGLDSAAVTVLENGNLTITDSAEAKTGAIYSNVSGKAAVKNLGAVTIDGGYYGSETTSSWYAITNYGTMTINGGHVENTADNTSDASLLRNGCTDSADTGKAETGTLTINGGTFETTNGCNVLKIETGSVEINGGHLLMNGKASDSGVIQCEAQLVINGGTVEHAKNWVANGLIWTDDKNTDRVSITLNGGMYRTVSKNVPLIYPNASSSARGEAAVVINKAESVGFTIGKNADVAATSVWINARQAGDSTLRTVIVPAGELGDVVELENGTAGTYFVDADFYTPMPTNTYPNLTLYVYKSFELEQTLNLSAQVGTVTMYLAEGVDVEKLTYVPYTEDYRVTITESTEDLPEARLGKTFVKAVTVKYEIIPEKAIMKVVNADGSVYGYYMTPFDASKAITDPTAQKIVMQRDLIPSSGGYSWSYSCTVDMAGHSIAAQTYAISNASSSSNKAFVFNNGTLKTLTANQDVISIAGSGTIVTANDCVIIGDQIAITKGSLILNNTAVQPVTEGGTVTVTLGNTASTFTVSGASFDGTVVSNVVGYDVVMTENNDGSVTYSLAAGEYVQLVRNGQTVGTYSTLDAALTDAAAGDTLKVIQDVEMYSTYVRIKKNVTIDLNGHTVRGKSTTGVLLVYAKALTVTVTDSSAAGTGAVINYCSINPSSVYSAVSSSYANVVLNIQGGTYTRLYLSQSTATLNLSGNVNAEEINNKGTTAVTAGTYNFDVSAYVAEGYAAVDNGDGTWTVEEATTA